MVNISQYTGLQQYTGRQKTKTKRQNKTKKRSNASDTCDRYQVSGTRRRERSKHEKSGRKEGRKACDSSQQPRDVGDILSVPTGNRRKEGTREKEQQPGAWRRYFSEHSVKPYRVRPNKVGKFTVLT